MTSCHLCNISLMLGRKLNWDPVKETFVGDEQATALMTRARRKGFELESTAAVGQLIGGNELRFPLAAVPA